MTLDIVDVSKSYGKKQALRSFNAQLTNGVYALLGPNGAGKSTLMNIITDIIKPSHGNVFWNGKSIYEDSEAYRQILGYLPQSPGFYNSFTAREFLMYIACLKGINNKKAAQAEAAKALELVNLTKDADRRIGTYSGGMKQRVGIAQALMGDPQIIILDQPTAGLDPSERIRFRNIISELSIERIVILATHIVSDVSQIAKKVLLLRSGRLIACSDVNELTSQLDGKIWVMKCTENEIDQYFSKYKIVSMRSQNNYAELRLISECKPAAEAETVQPTLEDVYLFHFEQSGGE